MADPQMPVDIVNAIRSRNWGTHHVHWHVVRIWDLLGPQVRQWAQQQGWSRAAVQEGESGNGLAFLAMHRVMMQQLRTRFPHHEALFVGWPTPPTDPSDAADPLPNNGNTAFSLDMGRAVTRLHQNLQSFTDDDDFGLYLETSLRPLSGQPDRRSPDRSAGIHNYMHNRFADSSSDIDMGNPQVNIENARFWRLHGWIDARWSALREAIGASDNEPAYVAALREAEHHMGHAMPHAHVAAEKVAPAPSPQPIPHDILRQIREALLQRAQE